MSARFSVTSHPPDLLSSNALRLSKCIGLPNASNSELTLQDTFAFIFYSPNHGHSSATNVLSMNSIKVSVAVDIMGSSVFVFRYPLSQQSWKRQQSTSNVCPSSLSIDRIPAHWPLISSFHLLMSYFLNGWWIGNILWNTFWHRIRAFNRWPLNSQWESHIVIPTGYSVKPSTLDANLLP